MSTHLKILEPEGLAAPMGHYCDAVIAGDTLYISGLLPTDASGALVGAGDVGEQARCVFENMGRLLSAAGCGPADVARTTIYMRDIGERLQMNAARKEFFGEHRPAATLIEVSGLALPEFLIEVDAIAVLAS
jgi:2-iminobutanoate/2-iminopropanoate deaminase